MTIPLISHITATPAASQANAFFSCRPCRTRTLVAALIFGAALGLLPLFSNSGQGAIHMESNGTVTSLGLPNEQIDGSKSRDMVFSTPPRETREEYVYPALPWGIVPQVHSFWPPYSQEQDPQGLTGQHKRRTHSGRPR